MACIVHIFYCMLRSPTAGMDFANTNLTNCSSLASVTIEKAH